MKMCNYRCVRIISGSKLYKERYLHLNWSISKIKIKCTVEALASDHLGNTKCDCKSWSFTKMCAHMQPPAEKIKELLALSFLPQSQGHTLSLAIINLPELFIWNLLSVNIIIVTVIMYCILLTVRVLTKNPKSFKTKKKSRSFQSIW